MNYDFSLFKENLLHTENSLKAEYKNISTGRATPGVLDGIQVESYGSYTAIAHVASVSIEDARTLRVAPWDKSQVNAIEKAIEAADLGLSVSSDDAGVRVYFPQLTTETRAKLVKVLKEKLEDSRVKVRTLREAEIKSLDAAEKEGGMGEDEKKKLKEDIQSFVDTTNKNLETIFKAKEEDTMTI